MKLSRLLLLLPALALLALASPAGATTGHHKVTICHATGSATNPYVTITVDREGLNGHGDHEDDIIPAPEGGCPKAAVTTATVAVTCLSPNTPYRVSVSVTSDTAGKDITINGQLVPEKTVVGTRVFPIAFVTLPPSINVNGKTFPLTAPECSWTITTTPPTTAPHADPLPLVVAAPAPSVAPVQAPVQVQDAAVTELAFTGSNLPLKAAVGGTLLGLGLLLLALGKFRRAA